MSQSDCELRGRSSSNYEPHKETELSALFEEQHFQMYNSLKESENDVLYVKDLIHVLEKRGIAADSPLVKDALEGMEEDEELTYERFMRMIKSSMKIELILKGLFCLFFSYHEVFYIIFFFLELL